MRLQLGTRGSPLALKQAEWVRAELLRRHPDLSIEIVTVRTSADRFPDRPLEAIGVGVFTRELDAALREGRIDLAVHSLKDLPSAPAEGVEIAAVPPRETPFDAFVSHDGTRLADLPRGARIGTGSPRRRAQLLAYRPDLVIEPLRGNVDTRLRKIEERALAGTVLAHAGLRRLGRTGLALEVLPADVMLPAVGQGALAVTTRKDDARVAAIVASLECPAARTETAAERAFLARLRAGCQVPAAGLARAGPGRVVLDVLLARPDGTEVLRTRREGAPEDAERLGKEAAEEILARGGDAILRSVGGLQP